jgi:hypothetical protein
MVAARGQLVFEYRPIPVSPMSVAVLILLALVTFVLGPLASPPELWPLGGLCFLPIAVVIVYVLLNRPSPTRIYSEGIEVSLSLWRRLLGFSRFYPWGDVVNVYPASYEISGAFLSPFASSAGTLVHTGIRLETEAGDRVLVRFTPGAIRAFRGETEGYVRAMDAVREVFLARGRSLVTKVRRYSDEEVRAMAERSREPLLGMATIVLAFLIPPALVAGVLLVLGTGPLALGLAVVAASLPPGISIALTSRRSQRRSAILSELSKFQESLRAAR